MAEVIPDDAVEAAAIAWSGPLEWLAHSDEWRDDRREDARSALEAAAPHMLAEAFEQGQKSGMRHAGRLVAAAEIGRPELPGTISPNPYRPTQ